VKTPTPICRAPERSVDAAFLRALDRDLIAALTSRHLARDGELLALQPDYVRWKDADGSLVGWRATVRVDGAPVRTYLTVRSAPTHRLANEAERLQHRADETWAGLGGLALVPEHDLLLLAFPLDRAMHDLRRVIRSSKVRSLVAEVCPHLVPAGHRFSKSRSTFALVRYKPERRAVLHWQIGCVDADGRSPAPTSLWVRCHAEATATRAGIAAAAAARAGVACPTPLGRAHDRLVVEGHVEGRPWTTNDRGAIAAAARTVATLHAAGGEPALPWHGPVQELDRALRAAEDLDRLSAAAGTRARRLADRLAALVPGPGPAVLAHGDLHAGQFLLDGDRAALCDFDRACIAPAALDLASFHAHCVLADAAGGRSMAAAFLSSYAARRELPPPAERAWWDACALLRAALLPFRSLRADWPQGVSRLLTAAESCLDAEALT
jgi:hypothetical protein